MMSRTLILVQVLATLAPAFSFVGCSGREKFPTTARLLALGNAYEHYLLSYGPLKEGISSDEIWDRLMRGRNAGAENLIEMPEEYLDPHGIPIDEWGRLLLIERVPKSARKIEIRSLGRDGKLGTDDDVKYTFGD